MSASQASTRQSPTAHHESADDYAGVVCQLGQFRVAVCRDNRQWLYQRRRRRAARVGPAWDTLGYCATRAGLIQLHRAHGGGDESAIRALPATITREGQS